MYKYKENQPTLILGSCKNFTLRLTFLKTKSLIKKFQIYCTNASELFCALSFFRVIIFKSLEN